MGFARIGIVTGVAEELAAFMPAAARVPLGGSPAVERIDGERIDGGRGDGGRGDGPGRAIFLCCAGIGKVAAATAAAMLHARHGVELLVVIGTAGRVGGEGGGPFLIAQAVQSDFGAQRPGGLVRYTAGAWPIGEAAVTAFRALDIGATGLPHAHIATSDLFVECGIHAAAVRDALGVTLVDMETAAVAQAAALLGLPWLAIKATTDTADEASAAGFQANLAAAARDAAAAMERVLEAI